MFDRILQTGHIALSEALLDEYRRVLYRKKLDKYLPEEKRQAILNRIEKNALVFIPSITITDCRDQKDNIVLELALTCKATCIITGDADLKVLHPFRSIPILSGTEFLTSYKR